jgi:endonuclease-8
MFLTFESGLVLRIHLGIYGKWNWVTEQVQDFLRQPVKGEVRARFYNDVALAELRGPTVCEILNKAEVELVLNRLGPDPLNLNLKGLERARFIDKVQSSRTAIGLLLMNQSVISGIGNVYRAELLFRAGIDPYTPGNRLSSEQLNELWKDSVALLKIGVKTSFMITRDELFNKNPSKADRNFVYKREGQPCRVCGTNISLAIEGGRKLYWCVSCQK